MNKILSPKKQWLALFLLSLGYATIYLDMTALNVALPYIQESFSATSTELFWVVNTYILTTASFALAGGRFGDIFGLRRVFLLGVAVFGLASIGCALSFSSSALIVWRAFQGIGGALTIANAAALIYQIFPKEKQGKAMGYFGITSVLFIVLGPLIGGFFTQYVNWRWVFWINPMVGSISFSFILVLLRGIDKHRDQKANFDYLGQLFLIGFMAPTITALMQAQKWGWSSNKILNLFCIGIAFFVCFFFYERKKEHPLLDFSLFKNNNFRISIILFFCSQFAVVSNVLFALYLEKCLHFEPFIAGLALLPGAFFGFFGNPMAGSLIDKYGAKRVIQAGLLSACLAFTWLALTAYTLNYIFMFISLLVISMALPLYMVGIFVLVMQTAEPNQKGMVAGISMTMRQTGGAFAVAFMTLIVGAFEQKYSMILSDQEAFTKGFSATMVLIALALGIAFYSSIWIGQEEKTAPSEVEENISS